jgi:hypothetical protein
MRGTVERYEFFIAPEKKGERHPGGIKCLTA